jgi:GxxExxY protein
VNGSDVNRRSLCNQLGHTKNLTGSKLAALELKAVTQIHPIHEAQLLTYLRLSGLPLGLLLNFNKVRLKDGIRRRRL